MVDQADNLENSQLSDLQAPSPGTPVEDIPEARREAPVVAPTVPIWRSPWMMGLIGLGAIAGIAAAIWLGQRSLLLAETAESPSSSPAVTPVTSTPSTPPTASPTSPTDSTPTRDNILGHYPYQEAPASDLVPITADGSIQLRTSAAQKFQAMIADAQAAGVNLIPLSGFRSFEDQKYLFFEVKAERGQDPETRAEVSAPPGYSEHHTGYAVDVTDANYPDTDLQVSFEQTPAFQWLEDNAAYYGFELSFPRDNEQGVQYEPWHWRYVGDPDSLETFYKRREPSTSP